MRKPVGPSIGDRVVEIEDGESEPFFIRPFRRAVGERFGEEKERTRGAFVGVPQWRVWLACGFRSRVSCLVTTGEEERSPASLFDRIELPYDPRQSTPGFARYATIVVRVPGGSEESVSIVR